MSQTSDRSRLTDGLGRVLRRPWQLKEAGRLSLDALVERYAAQRELDYEPAGETPPATWFLESVEPERSHGFLRGRLAGGPSGRLFFVERPVTIRRRRQLMTGWTVALYDLAGAVELAYGIACLFAPGAAWGGRVAIPVQVPHNLVETGEAGLGLPERFLVAVSAGDETALGRLFDAAFVDWLERLPWRKTGEELIRFELRNGRLCVYAKPKARTSEALDAFCARAAHVAERVSAAAAGR